MAQNATIEFHIQKSYFTLYHTIDRSRTELCKVRPKYSNLFILIDTKLLHVSKMSTERYR